MKLKTRLSFCTSTVAGAGDDYDDTNNFTGNLTPTSTTSASLESSNITSSSSLQSHSSLQTLPSVPSLQSLLDDTTSLTLTHSLSSSLTLSSSITSLSLSSTSSSSSSSSSSLLYASSGHLINVYDSSTLAHLDTFNANSPSSGAVKSIAFSNGKVLTAHQDGKIRVWKLTEKISEKMEIKTSEQKHKLVSTLPTLSDRLMNFPIPKNHVQVRRHKTRLWVEHNDAVSSLAVTTSRIYSVSWDKTLKIWGPGDLKCKESVTASEDAVNAVTVSVDGVVYTGSAEGRIKVWRKKTETCGSDKRHGLVATLEKHKSAVNALTLNNDGTILFSGACDRSILVWEREDSGKYMSVSGALRGHGGAILCLINVGDFLVSGSADRTVRIWRRSGCEGKFCCLTVLTGHKKAVKCLAGKMVEGENGILVFSGGLDGEIKVWSVKVNRN